LGSYQRAAARQRKKELTGMKSELRILYLEDDPRDAELVQETLAGDGIDCHLTRVESEADFIASLEKGGVDLILADYSLPSFDGLSAMKIAQQDWPHVPFIFVSGTLDEEVAIEALKIGATDYVFKTRLSRILPSVQRALREADEKTERSHAEQKLRRSEAYLAEAQRLSLTGSFGWNASTGEIFWSEETFRIFQEDRTTTPTVELVLQRTHPEDVTFVKETLERASQDGTDLDFEHRLLMPDGSVKHVHVVGHAQRDKSGKLELVGAVLDVSERKRAEGALRQMQADLAHVSRVTTVGELVASIAHEVNQPLSAIVINGHACVRLLSRDTPDLDKSREMVGRMIKDGMRASEVIKRIRDLLHKAPTEKTPLNINETVQEVIELVNNDVRRSKVELQTKLAADLPPVVGDRIQLQQVILNLILNAKDAINEAQPHPREMLIASRKNESGEVLVAVQDSGKGLDPKDAERIFDPFFTTKAEGMGLGLSISRKIIEDHGGRMWATPNEPRGAVVQFTLPAESESESVLWR
jgi:signal transduction histidine kinase